jgi:hypothetical protein
MPGILRSAFSGADNVSIDIGRVNWTLLVIALIAYTGYEVIGLHHAFDCVNFATGAGALLAAGGAALKLKSSTEPKV